MFIISQILFILISILSAKSEQYATYPYRMGNMPANSKQSRFFHAWGAALIFILMISFAWFCGVSIFDKCILFLLNGLIYWLLFDSLYSLFIGQKWHYLGTTAKTDIILRKIFGKNAGKGKALACLLLIIIINILKQTNTI